MKNNISYGNVDVTEELSREVAKVRTTMFLDIELKSLLKAEASERGIKYQQLIREILKSYFSDKESLEDRIKKLESIILKEA